MIRWFVLIISIILFQRAAHASAARQAEEPFIGWAGESYKGPTGGHGKVSLLPPHESMTSSAVLILLMHLPIAMHLQEAGDNQKWCVAAAVGQAVAGQQPIRDHATLIIVGTGAFSIHHNHTTHFNNSAVTQQAANTTSVVCCTPLKVAHLARPPTHTTHTPRHSLTP
jgi:hypothetical protein